MDILVAEKNGINNGSIVNKSGLGTGDSNYKPNDLVQIYANDGTPSGKITRDALFSCCKDALGTLLNQGAADLGTSLAKIPALNSGGTLGSATVANLASVLGGAKRLLTSSDNMNDVTEAGVYAYINAQNPVNAPSGTANCVVLVLRAYFATRCEQIVWDYNTNKQFFRVIDFGNPPLAKDWQEVTANLPAFYKNYATLQNLISAAFTTIGNVSDANDAPIGICTLTSNGSHLPVPAQLLCLTLGGYSQRVQLAFRFINGEVYTRVCNDTTWGSWYKIDVTIVQ